MSGSMIGKKQPFVFDSIIMLTVTNYHRFSQQMTSDGLDYLHDSSGV